MAQENEPCLEVWEFTAGKEDGELHRRWRARWDEFDGVREANMACIREATRVGQESLKREDKRSFIVVRLQGDSAEAISLYQDYLGVTGMLLGCPELVAVGALMSLAGGLRPEWWNGDWTSRVEWGEVVSAWSEWKKRGGTAAVI